MPGNFLSILVGWAASHLVALSLLAFVFAGLLVFGVIQPPGGPVARGMLGTESSARPAANGQGPAASVTSVPSAAESGQEGEVLKPAHEEAAPQINQPEGQSIRRKTPKLIGGSLPVYDQSRFPPPVEAPPAEAPPTGATAADAGFRPGTEVQPAESPPTREDLVQRARRAFWNGDFEAAEGDYMALISAYPDDADAFGELGNLYQSMGKGDAARDAYFEAGLRLKATGEKEKLSQIIDLLTREGDPRIDQLAP